MSKTWMLTQSRRRVHPLEFTPDDVWLPDIAASLAKQCRYNGHTDFFYSVAEHSVLVSRALQRDGYSTELQQIGLLHDASECWTGDIIRPIKNALEEQGFSLKPIENEIERVVSEKFGLPFPWPDVIHEYDNRIIRDEKEQLKFDPTNTWEDFGAPLLGLDLKIEAWEWEQAQREYMFCAYELGLRDHRNPFANKNGVVPMCAHNIPINLDCVECNESCPF